MHLALFLFLAAGGPFELLLAPSTEGNRRNSEGDILPLKDGRLMLAADYFYSDYKDFGGLFVPTASKVKHDDKLFLDITVTDFKPLKTTDEKFDTGS